MKSFNKMTFYSLHILLLVIITPLSGIYNSSGGVLAVPVSKFTKQFCPDALTPIDYTSSNHRENDTRYNINRFKRDTPNPMVESTSIPWEKSTLTWGLSPEHYPKKDLSFDSTKTAIRYAIDMWQDIAPFMKFVEMEVKPEGPQPDILIGFFNGSHGDAFTFENNTSIMAHTFLPGNSPIAGHMHINLDKNYTMFLINDTHDSVYYIVLHEFGHSLGLHHSMDKNSIMYPYMQTRAFEPLHPIDRDALFNLYKDRIVEWTRQKNNNTSNSSEGENYREPHTTRIAEITTTTQRPLFTTPTPPTTTLSTRLPKTDLPQLPPRHNSFPQTPTIYTTNTYRPNVPRTRSSFNYNTRTQTISTPRTPLTTRYAPSRLPPRYPSRITTTTPTPYYSSSVKKNTLINQQGHLVEAKRPKSRDRHSKFRRRRRPTIKKTFSNKNYNESKPTITVRVYSPPDHRVPSSSCSRSHVWTHNNRLYSNRIKTHRKQYNNRHRSNNRHNNYKRKHQKHVKKNPYKYNYYNLSK